MTGNGYELSETLLPLNSHSKPRRLQLFFSSTNHANVKTDFQYQIKYEKTSGLKLSGKEANHWVDVYVAYWKAVGEIVRTEERIQTGSSVRISSGCDDWLDLTLSKVKWSSVYDLWKELVNTLHRGYTNGDFEAWTVPCMYVVGKYLRVFAIKADDEAGANEIVAGTFQEEPNPDAGINEKLEDCARVLNRLFQLCIADRLVEILSDDVKFC